MKTKKLRLQDRVLYIYDVRFSQFYKSYLLADINLYSVSPSSVIWCEMKLTALRQTKVHQRAHSFLNLNSTITYLHLNHFECTEFLLIVYLLWHSHHFVSNGTLSCLPHSIYYDIVTILFLMEHWVVYLTLFIMT
jgi:hypothetical protein